MKTWPVHDAKARFSELLEACIAEGPQMVSKRGAEAAVLVSATEWRRLNEVARPSLKELLLAANAPIDLTFPARGGARRRTAAVLSE